jgi:predicted nucleic acid-binding protein
MQTVIVDTDIAIDYLRGFQYAKELMLFLWNTDNAYLSILSVYELYAGMKDNETLDTENFIKACIIEPLTIDVTRKAGSLYKKYRTQGLTLTSIDCLINATAIIRGHKIATKNINHYPDKKTLFSVEPLKGSSEKHTRN